MNISGKIGKILTACLLLGTSVPLFAGAWPCEGSKRRVTTLIVTANYAYPRMIAELIQAESRQPILLFPAKEGGPIIFCPTAKRFGVARQIPASKVPAFVKFLNPKQIVVLGGTRYIPQRYRAMLDPSVPTIVAQAQNWQSVADMLGKLLRLSNLPSNFARLRAKYDSGRLYQPTGVPIVKEEQATDSSAMPESESAELPAETPAETSTEAPAETSAETSDEAPAEPALPQDAAAEAPAAA